jgi:hypothetical protein
VRVQFTTLVTRGHVDPLKFAFTSDLDVVGSLDKVGTLMFSAETTSQERKKKSGGLSNTDGDCARWHYSCTMARLCAVSDRVLLLYVKAGKIGK